MSERKRLSASPVAFILSEKTTAIETDEITATPARTINAIRNIFEFFFIFRQSTLMDERNFDDLRRCLRWLSTYREAIGLLFYVRDNYRHGD